MPPKTKKFKMKKKLSPVLLAWKSTSFHVMSLTKRPLKSVTDFSFFTVPDSTHSKHSGTAGALGCPWVGWNFPGQQRHTPLFSLLLTQI